MRFKNRYLLFELVTPGAPPEELSPEQLAEALRAGVEAAGGAVGAARVFSAFKVICCSPAANYFAVRTAKAHCAPLLQALFYLRELDGRRARFRLLGVSGTVKKLEERLLLAFKAGQHRDVRRAAEGAPPRLQ